MATPSSSTKRDGGHAFGRVRFGPFVLDPVERRLTRDGDDAALPRKAFDLLLALVESPGRLQSRDVLIARLWPNAVVEEHSLTWNVSTLRRALGDTGETPLYIETVRGHGYRFIADVTELAAETRETPHDDATTTDSAPESPADVAPPPTVATRGRSLRRVAVLVALLAATAAAWLFGRHGGIAPPHTPPAHSLAVLPFENLSTNADVAYFANGIQNTIITKLAGIGDLQVMSRSSTKNYQSHPADVRTVAAQLNVAAVLEGAVQRDGAQVQVNVQLIDGRSGRLLWAESYRRAFDNVFDIERDIAEHVAEALQARLVVAEAARVARAPTSDAAAYDLFLKAEYLAERVGRVSVADMTAATVEARRLYAEAIARDPQFALAWARLSYLDSVAYWFHVDTSPQAIADAERAAVKALELDPELPQAHLARGYVHYYGKRDYAAALAEFDHARRALPGDSEIGAAIASIHRRQGRLDDAVAGYGRVASLDSRNARWPVLLGDTYTMLRRYDDALQAYERARAVDPTNHAPLIYESLTLLLTGELARARQTLAAIPDGFDPGGVVSELRYVAGWLQRDADAALSALAAAPEWVEALYVPSHIPTELLRAQAWELKGDETRARASYERARDLLRQRLHDAPDEPGLLGLLGLALAGLGENEAALASGRRAHALVPLASDAMDAPTYLAVLAEIEARTGETAAAAEHLRELLRVPAGGIVSAQLIAIDPRYDGVRDALRASGDIR